MTVIKIYIWFVCLKCLFGNKNNKPYFLFLPTYRRTNIENQIAAVIFIFFLNFNLSSIRLFVYCSSLPLKKNATKK